MSFHTIHPEVSVFKQISRGFVTGFRWFIRLLIIGIIFATAGTFLYKFGAQDIDESREAVETHRDIRRSIAQGMSGSAAMPVSAAMASAPPKVEPWRELSSPVLVHTEESGFRSRVDIREVDGDTKFRMVFGPYDPETSQNIKQSPGWVTLKFFQAHGVPVPNLEGGVKIQLSSFEFYEVGGIPVGWSYSGTLGQDLGALPTDIKSFDVGWVIPSGAMTRESAQISLR